MIKSHTSITCSYIDVVSSYMIANHSYLNNLSNNFLLHQLIRVSV